MFILFFKYKLILLYLKKRAQCLTYEFGMDQCGSTFFLLLFFFIGFLLK